jgi:hypothetical protein
VSFECRKSPTIQKNLRTLREMPQLSGLELDYTSPDPLTSQPSASLGSSNQRVRPQGNKVAKEDHKNIKIRDAAIRVQAAATLEMAAASKRKADILEDQNVLMVFITHEAINISKETRKYLKMRCTLSSKNYVGRLQRRKRLKKTSSV